MHVWRAFECIVQSVSVKRKLRHRHRLQEGDLMLAHKCSIRVRVNQFMRISSHHGKFYGEVNDVQVYITNLEWVSHHIVYVYQRYVCDFTR